MLLRYERSHLGRLIARRSDEHALHGRFEQLEESVENFSLDEDAAARTAVLPRILEHRVGRSRRGFLEIRVGEDDVRALAAELERHGFDVRRASGHHRLADRRRSREYDLADIRMRDEPLADHRTLPRQHLQQPLREARLDRDLGETNGGERRPLGGFHHDRVAGGERGCEAPAGDRHGKVPRHDDSDDADRLMERDVHAAGHRDLHPDKALGCRRVVLDHVSHMAGFPASLRDRMPGVQHLELSKLLDLLADPPRETPQGFGATRGRKCRPSALHIDSAGDRVVDVRDRGVPHFADDSLVGGIDQGCECHRAASTSAWNKRRSAASSSGCHCTAIPKGTVDSSTASTMPSSERAETSSPSATRSRA